MAARITEVRDAVAAKIIDWWDPDLPDEVLALSKPNIDSQTLVGRKVHVFRSMYTRPPADRLHDQGDYSIAVMIVERYTGPDDPDSDFLFESWVGGLVDWCDQLLELLGDARGPRLLADPLDQTTGLWPETAECTAVHDIEELSRKLFVSVLSFMFREHAVA